MDPSIILCRYKNSFQQNGEIPSVLHTYVSSGKTDNNKQSNEYKKSERVLHDIELFDQVNNYRFDRRYIDLYDPFHNTPIKPFMSRDTITLANIDSVFNFSKHTQGYIIKQDTKDFSFAVIDDGPGKFVEYILYRNPNSYGYGISKVPYNDLILDVTHFNIIRGKSGTSNIEKDYKSFIKTIRTVEATGVDIVIADYPNNKITSMNFMVKLITCLSIINIGGTFVSKISLNDELIDLLYIVSQCFDKITLFKPISTSFSDKDNTYYLVAQDAKTNNIEWISYLKYSLSKSINQGKTVARLIDNIPKDFIDWITEYNNLMLLYKKYLIELGETKIYDTYKCKTIWNLP